ncbi:MAG: hypothetical protein KDA44_13375 [Planctomycetales bacterium]|nr:hypothetical protein [Planctomycetales bacterium]
MHSAKLPLLSALIAAATLYAVTPSAQAVLTYTISGTWDTTARRDAADAAMQAVVNLYNAYSPTGFDNRNVYVYYDAGIPTAQASYGGAIGFGGTYPAQRVTQHEMAHYLGLPSGNWNSLMSGGWSGPQAAALVKQFDGDQATLNGDSIHFWPYGLNYDNEFSGINAQRQVAMVYAMRADLGIGPTAHPSAATTVALTASDPYGQSGFNYSDRWSDGYFAHAGADYSTGPYQMRTPQSANSFTFAGRSLTLDDSTDSTGLLFKGEGAGGVVTIDDLQLDGGWITHAGTNGVADLFQLAGNVNVVSDSNIRANNGNINILADVHGDGALTIRPTSNINENNRYVRFKSAHNTFTGDIVNEARFELAAGANFKFEIGPAGVSNAITGAAARTTLINGLFEFDFSGASANQGDSWALVTAANTSYGANFNIAGFDSTGGVWSNGDYSFTQATGLLTLVTAWATDGGGLWSNAGNWTGGVPAAGGDATLGSALTAPHAPATVSLDAPVTLNRLTFDNASRYVIAGANALTLTGGAQLAAKSGSHEIAVPVAGTAGLAITGNGTVELSAANPYSGDTNIHSGTLKLTGAATIANSANIRVHPGATLDVSGVSAPFTLAGGQTLHNDSNTTVVGNVAAASGAVVTGAGAFADNLDMQAGSTLRIGAAGLPIASSLALIDNFDSYNNSTNQNIGAHGNGDVTGGKWDGVFDGTNNGQIVDNANPADNALVAFGIPGQGAGGWRGGVTNLAANFPTDVSLPDGDTATYFFQVMNEGNAYADTMIGLTETLGSLDINDAWQDFSVMPFVAGNPGSAQLKAAGQTIAPLVDGQWQNVWLVVDNANKTFDVYTSTGDDQGVLALNDVGFTYQANPVNLEAFGIAGREDGRVRIDNIYVAEGENTANPLAAGGGILYAPEVLTVAGDVTLQAGSTVSFDIAAAGVNDRLDIGGEFLAAGTLAVTLDGAAPALGLGDAFDLFDFATAAGSFDAFNLPSLAAGLVWNVSDLTVTGELSVVADVDLDDNGLVDGGDFLLLQRSDPAALATWQNQFGNHVIASAPPPPPRTAAVPEPATATLAGLCAFVSGLAARRLRQRRCS